MKKATTTIIIVFVLAIATQAQFVNIPDSNFRKLLITKFPTCFNSGGLMDTTCSKIVDTLVLTCWSSSLRDLTGIQYFKKIQFLDCSNNLLTNTSNFPDSLKTLHCNGNPNLTCLGRLPLKLKTLVIDSNNVQCLPNTVIGLNVYGTLSFTGLPSNRHWTYSNPLNRLICWNDFSKTPYAPFGTLASSCQFYPTTQIITCPDSIVTLVSKVKGTTYSWQRPRRGTFLEGFDSQSQFISFMDSNTDTLRIVKSQFLDFKSGFYTYRPIKYYCFADGVYNSFEFMIDFSNIWTGSVSSAWENPGNWSCGKIPDQYTEVIIPYGKTVIINSNPTIQNIKVNATANVTVNTGYKLTILN
jgi:hypothetical protein